LQIDHKKGNGRDDALTVGELRKILLGTKGLEDYQCLCANCNAIKAFENSECRTSLPQNGSSLSAGIDGKLAIAMFFPNSD